MAVQLLIIPVIGAFIGWITNVLAIRFIFWPYEPVTIPFINITIQGLIPKRRKEIASNIGAIIERELLSAHDVTAYLNESGTKKRILTIAINVGKNTVLEKVPRYFPGFVRESIDNSIEKALKREIPQAVDLISKDLNNHIQSNLDLRKIVEDRLNCLKMTSLEQLAIEVSARELSHIKIVGAVLGFLIGLVQAAWVAFFF